MRRAAAGVGENIVHRAMSKLAVLSLVAGTITVALSAGAPTPAQAVTSGVAPIAAGQHTCAITQAGTITCWGADTYGRLGNGPTTSSDPVTVTGLTGATAVAATVGHTCAVSNGGAVTCWGLNANGQLGNGNTTGANAPVAVTGMTSGATAVATGSAHSCAVDAAGGVMCWGSGTSGRLGNGLTTPSLTPVSVLGLGSGVARVVAGAAHTCALSTGGGVWCWGANSSGQLGTGNTTSSTFPIPVPGLGSGVTSLSAAGARTCAVNASKAVLCWGAGAAFPLGGNATSPTAVLGVANATSVSAGDTHACAVTTTAGVLCWGQNTNGQLGDRSLANSYFAVQVQGLTAGVRTVAAGAAHTCALRTNGTVTCWGGTVSGAHNISNQLGDNSTTNSSFPVPVAGATSGVTTLSTGPNHTCVQGPTVRCWGFNSGGQVGNGSSGDRSAPVPITETNATQVDGGGTHTCARTSSGGARCWGANTVGQLGNNTTTSSLAPVDVSGLTSGTAAVTAGLNHSCALSQAGAVSCWGDNGYGQLGDGTTTSSSVPVPVTGLSSGVTAISAGSNHTCAISGGALTCWGDNSTAQLGNGTTTSSSTPVPVTGMGTGVVAVSAGAAHTCAISGVNAASCWGNGNDGRLGNGSTATVATPATVSGLAGGTLGALGATAIAAGGAFSCAVTTNGGATCWGLGGSGQLGNSSGSSQTTPVNVTGLSSGVAGVAVGYSHACAATTAGAASCWGLNSQGQLGMGIWSPITNVMGGATFWSGGPTLGITATRHPQPNANGWNNTPVAVTFVCTGGTAPVTCPGMNLLGPGFDQTGSGTTTDSVGGSATTSVTGINVDLSPPELIGMGGPPPNLAGWHRSDVTMSWSCSDDLSGVDGPCPSTQVLTGETGGYQQTQTITDRAGNSSTVSTPVIKVDRTAPVTTVTPQFPPRPPGAASYTRSPVAVWVTATDGLSGVATVSWSLDGGPTQTRPGSSPAPITVTGEGTHTVAVWSTDVAGNESTPNSVTFTIDDTAPIVEGEVIPPPNEHGWNTEPVVISWGCTDQGGSGIAYCSPSFSTNTNGSALQFDGEAGDRAGNAGTASLFANIDTYPPTLSGALVPNGDGSATLHWTCNDATSGIASCPPSEVVPANARGTVSRTAVDAAGNESDPATVALGQSSFGQPLTITKTTTLGTKGTMSFWDGTTLLASRTVTAGTATYTTSTLPVGSHELSITYKATSTSAPVEIDRWTHEVRQTATSTALTSSANPSVVGQATLLTATVGAVAPGGGTPTGTVTFSDGATLLGTKSLVRGVATLSVRPGLGVHHLTAVYAGATGYAGSTSPSLDHTVGQAASTMTVTSPANPTVTGQSTTLRIKVLTAAPGSGTPTGTVDIFDGATLLGTRTLASGQTTFAVKAAVGSHPLTVTYNGSANLTSSTSAVLHQVVNPAATTTTVSSPYPSAVHGQTGVLTAKVAAVLPGTGAVTGTVEFFDDGVSIGTAPIVSGRATFPLAGLAVGTHPITAAFAGNPSYLSSTTTTAFIQTIT